MKTFSFNNIEILATGLSGFEFALVVFGVLLAIIGVMLSLFILLFWMSSVISQALGFGQWVKWLLFGLGSLAAIIYLVKK